MPRRVVSALTSTGHSLASPIPLTVLALGLVMAYVVLKRLFLSPYRHINGPRSTGFLLGHKPQIFNRSPRGVEFHDSLQENYGSICRVRGYLGIDDLYISDPSALNHILVQKQTIFPHPPDFYQINKVIFGPGIFAMSGSAHRAQRKMLNPVFQLEYMKSMIPIFHTIAQDMKQAMLRAIEPNEPSAPDVDLLEWCSCAALEFIGQAGLGLKFGLFEGIKSEFCEAARGLFPAQISLALFQPVIPYLCRIRPKWLARYLANIAPNRNVQRLKHIIDVQHRQAQEILANRKQKLDTDGEDSDCNDLLGLLLRENKRGDTAAQLPEDQLLSQIAGLVFAAHETTSGALARLLHRLSMDPRRQERLRSEIQEAHARWGETLDYTELHALPYLDALCRESLRLDAPVPVVRRVNLEPCVLPLRYHVKGTDGRLITEVYLEKGTKMYVSLREANRCKETWGEDADKFIPERWLQDLPKSVSAANTCGIYSMTMTFSAGPRSCIGFGFSLLELKILLIALIATFRFGPSDGAIEWPFGITMMPYRAGNNRRPTLPLKVTKV